MPCRPRAVTGRSRQRRHRRGFRPNVLFHFVDECPRRRRTGRTVPERVGRNFVEELGGKGQGRMAAAIEYDARFCEHLLLPTDRKGASMRHHGPLPVDAKRPGLSTEKRGLWARRCAEAVNGRYNQGTL